MKKLWIFISLLSIWALSGCQQSADTLKIGVNFYPMPQIVELIEADLLADGIKVEMVNMDYNLLNTPLNNKEIDGNLIQHQYFMQFFNNANNANLVVAQPVYHSIFSLYSAVYEADSENNINVEDGETVYLPEDVVNLPRALILLDALELISLSAGVDVFATLDDIESNPRNLVFEPRSLGTTSSAYHSDGSKLAIMYPTYARDTNNQLMDESQVLAYEELNDLTRTYAISFVTRADNLNDPRIQTFIEYLTSQKVRTWIEENYGWAATPAF